MPTSRTPLQRARWRLGERLRASPAGRDWIVRQFHRLYFELGDQTWLDTRWRGELVAKSPLDLWLYQELIAEARPQLLIETGTFRGGSAWFFGDLLELIGDGRVVTIDLNPGARRPPHPRVDYLVGSSVDPAVVADVTARAEGCRAGDGRARLRPPRAHVRAELDAYAGLVTPGSLLVVEDTVVGGRPLDPEFGPGPFEAVESFLAAHPEFSRDPRGEKFLMTFNRGGWLRRAP